MSRNGMPGPGGSLGCCAWCGKPFLAEILMGKSVVTFSVDQVQGSLYAHAACMTLAEHTKTLLEWPEESPLRKAVEAHNATMPNS